MPDSASPALPAALDLRALPIATIHPDGTQPRRHFDQDALNELAASVRDHGVVQPIIVRPTSLLLDAVDPHWTIVAGERRWRASIIAGLETIPAIVRHDLDADSIAVLQLIENLQRADLTLWETAIGCSKLVESIGLDAAAQRLGYSKPWVSQRATLTGLPIEFTDLISAGLLVDVETAHNLFALSELDADGADAVAEAFELIADGNPPTRSQVREKLREARADIEAIAARERQREQKRQDEAEESASRDPFTLTPTDDEDDDGDTQSASTPKPKAAATRAETPHERERRLREEAWTELMPDCRKLAREARKAILSTLDDCTDADHRAKNFEITVSQPLTHSDCPAKPAGAKYGLDIRGNTADAGLIIEALDPKHTVMLNTRVTIAQLRQIEDLLGEYFPVRTTADYGGSGSVHIHGSRLANAAALVVQTHEARQHAQAESTARLKRVCDLLDADDARAATPSATHCDRGSAAAEEAIHPEQEEGDIAAFLKACTQRDSESRVKAADLHAAYVSWCGRHGRTPIQITAHNWGRPIAAAGIEKRRSNGFVYVGIKLLIEADA